MKKNTFAERFKKLRKQNGYTQGQIAEMVGYKKTAVCDWETRGKEPSFDVVIKLCQIFNTSADYLLGIN